MLFDTIIFHHNIPLQSIPGQEDLCQFFESKMSDPVGLQRAASSSAVLPAKKLRTVIHGDLWHNNIYFRAGREVAKKAEEVMVTDWQMCHMGTATNDLCFLLFSSTTPSKSLIVVCFTKLQRRWTC